MEKVIEIAKLIGIYPSTRMECDGLFEKINKSEEDHIIIDFDGVFGITHSFGAQYRDNKKKCDKTIEEESENNNVYRMFYIIEQRTLKQDEQTEN